MGFSPNIIHSLNENDGRQRFYLLGPVPLPVARSFSRVVAVEGNIALYPVRARRWARYPNIRAKYGNVLSF